MVNANISRSWAWAMFIVASLFYGFEYLLRVIPSIMVPNLMATYDITAQQVGVLSAFYYYTYTPLQLVAGTMIDHYGARKILTLSLIACVIGTYLFGMTNDLTLAKVGRASIGFGSAFAFVGAMRICSDWLPKNLFATLAGLTTTIGMVGAISGEISLALMKDNLGITRTFQACLVFGAVLTVATWMIVRTKQLFSVKCGKAEVVSLFQHMLFLMKMPIFWNISIIGLCLFMPTTIFASLWAVKFLDDVYQVSDPAKFSSMIFLGWAVGGPIVGLLKRYLNAKDKYTLAIGALGAFIAAVFIIYFPHIAKHYLLLLMFLFGFFSSSEVLVFDINHILSGPALCGTSVALTNMVIMLGGFVQPLVGVLLDQRHIDKVTHYTACDYKVALAIIPISFLTGFILSIFFKEDKVVPPDNIPE